MFLPEFTDSDMLICESLAGNGLQLVAPWRLTIIGVLERGFEVDMRRLKLLLSCLVGLTLFSPFASHAQGLDITSIINQTAPASVAKFERFKKRLWPEAKRKGVSRAMFTRAFAGVLPDPAVLKSAAKQPEFTTPPWDYINKRVSDRRIGNGQEKLAELPGVLREIEARYGVDRHIVVSIWGMESSYGFILNNSKIVRPVIQSLATLAFNGKSQRRRKFGRTQLLAALQILQNGDTVPERMLGSWAGAMGHTQFIPTTYRAYAVDFDGDGRRDIWDNEADALASTAAYLKKSGWQTGKTWGYEVKLPSNYNYGVTGRKIKKSLADWSRLGVRRANGKPFPRPGDVAWMEIMAGGRGPAFLMLKNFRAIMRYNNSVSYALAVGHLADRLRGGNDFIQPWPEGDRMLTRAERLDLQRQLRARGYGIAKIDGKIGPNTRKAVRAFQARNGMAADGFVTKNLLDRLRQSS